MEYKKLTVTELEEYIQTYFAVGTHDLPHIVSFFKLIQLKKGDYFIQTGKYADKLGFVQSGIIREHVYIDGKEVTKWISTKGYFVAELNSLFFHQPARWNMQVLTDCELFVIEKSNYLKIGQAIPAWQDKTNPKFRILKLERGSNLCCDWLSF